MPTSNIIVYILQCSSLILKYLFKMFIVLCQNKITNYFNTDFIYSIVIGTVQENFFYVSLEKKLKILKFILALHPNDPKIV